MSGKVEMNELLQLCVDEGASDLHLAVGAPPILRIHGGLSPIDTDVLTNEDTERLMKSITSPDHQQKVREQGGTDFGFGFGDQARFRVSVLKQKGNVGVVLRQIPNELLDLEKIGLPPQVKELLFRPRGLVLVTGPTGSGKSTTLAAIVHEANNNRKEHILTIEDPIEFVHKSEKAIVNHREVGIHTRSFSAALRGALREDPDIIMVGEMRDLETISLAIEASATGHLVFGTLHTTSSAKTVDRVIEVFPVNQQEQIRNTLADGLRAVLAQTLFKRRDRKGRVAALEIMIANPAVRNLIREGKTFQIPSMLQTGKKYGMQTLDDAIMELLNRKIISPDDAYTKAVDKSKFLPFLKKPPSDFTEV